MSTEEERRHIWKQFEAAAVEARRVATTLRPMPELAERARAMIGSDDVQTWWCLCRNYLIYTMWSIRLRNTFEMR